jgi:hypothetical protein
MPQQVNLFNPILLAPKRYFSAAAMVQSLGALVVGLALLGGWTAAETRQLRAGLAASGAAHEAEKRHLDAALARLPAPRDRAALEQELAQSERALAEIRERLEALQGGPRGAPPAAWLELIAATAPPPLWITELRLAGPRVELGGAMLQPEVLRPWLERLGRDPLAGDRGFVALRVEQGDGAAGVWTFHADSAPPARPGTGAGR